MLAFFMALILLGFVSLVALILLWLVCLVTLIFLGGVGIFFMAGAFPLSHAVACKCAEWGGGSE